MHYLSKTFKLIVPRDLTWDDVERLLGITKSSLSHVQLKNGTVVGHVTRNMSSKLQFFIKYEGLLEMKVSGAGFTQRIKTYCISSEQEKAKSFYWFQEKLRHLIPRKLKCVLNQCALNWSSSISD